MMICDDCGLGKTVTAIGMMANIKSYAPDFKQLLVIKKSIKQQWILAIQNWSKLKIMTLPHHSNEIVCEKIFDPKTFLDNFLIQKRFWKIF